MAIDTRFGYEGANEVNVNKSYIAEERNSKRDESNFQDWAGVIGGAASGVAQTAIIMKDAEDKTEAIEAKTHVNLIKTSDGYSEANYTNKKAMLEEARNAMLDKSPAYQSSFINSSASEIMRVDKGALAETIVREQNNMGTNKSAWDTQLQYDVTDDEGNPVTNEEAGALPQDFVDQYHKSNPYMSKSEIKYGLLSNVLIDVKEGIDAAETMEELNAAIVDGNDIKEPYMNDTFLTTKEKNGQQEIAAAEREIATSVSNAQARIKEKSYDFLADNEANGNRVPPNKVYKHIEATSSNSFTAEKAKTAYDEKYVERIQADNYANMNPIGERKSYLPDNATIKKERQVGVTTTLFSNFNAGNMQDFVRIAQNESTMTKETGDQFVTMFNNASTTKELTVLNDKFNLIDAQPQGASVLRQMLTDDEYTRIKEIGYAIQSRPDLTPGQARDWIDGNKAKLNTLGLPPAKQKKLFEYAVKLGPQYDAYMSHMKQVMLGNPSIGEKEMKDAATRFSTMNTKDSTNMKSDTSMGSNPADGASVMNSGDVDVKINTALGDGVTDKKFLSNGIVIGKDAYGGTMKIINTNDVVDAEGTVTTKGIISKSNDETTTKLLVENEESKADLRGDNGILTGLWTGTKKAVGSFVRDSVDNFTEIPKGLAKSGGRLIDRFNQHLYDSMTTSQREWWDDLTEEDQSDIIGSEITSAINLLDTSKGLQGVHNITLTDSEKLQFDQSMLTNKFKKEALEEVNKSVGISAFNEKIGGIESNNKYTAHRKGSQYYGKYQISETLAKESSSKLGIPYREWKEPKNQEKIFNYLVTGYHKQLKKEGIPVNDFTTYMVHQQGFKGLKEILKGGDLNSTRISNMRGNLPRSKVALITDKAVRGVFLNYWKNKLK